MKSNEATNPNITIPNVLIWAQCLVFAVLYGIWMIREIMGLRRATLIIGAGLGLYSIYQYRASFIQKRALPVWLIVGLFAWASFHLCYLTQDYPTQLMEFSRIWKYAALGGIFALGLGLSLANTNKKTMFWPMIYFGLCSPLFIYLLKYVLTRYGASLGIAVPDYLKIFSEVNIYYIPKTDYVAFCLPVLAVSLGQIYDFLVSGARLTLQKCLVIGVYLLIIAGTLFLFYAQDTKNGIAYATLLLMMFMALLLLGRPSEKRGRNFLISALVVGALGVVLYPHIQKNHSWSTLMADTKVGLQLDRYSQWRYAGAQGYPNNEYGETVSVTNYERAAWFKAGLQLATQTPLGYGLVEDSFKRMAIAKWPDASPNLSHSHSGWLDLILGIGFPGFFCILGALILALKQSTEMQDPWRSFVFFALVANLILWVTTEVSATITFEALIFWVSWACGLTLMPNNLKDSARNAL